MPRALCLVLVFLVGSVVHAAPTDDDRDGDGIPNNVDLCPDDPEDQDGFEDQDGCPDPDNDQDRIPDAVDMCPNEPETYNGYQDKDGCPDKLRVHYIGSADAILDRIYFLPGSAIIKPVSMPILDQLAAALKANPSVVSATCVGHASRDEHDAPALSLARAQAVMAYLVKQGVAAKQLHAVGKGTAADPGAPTGKTDPSIHRVVHFDMVRGEVGKAMTVSWLRQRSACAKPCPRLQRTRQACAVAAAPRRAAAQFAAGDGVVLAAEAHGTQEMPRSVHRPCVCRSGAGRGQVVGRYPTSRPTGSAVDRRLSGAGDIRAERVRIVGPRIAYVDGSASVATTRRVRGAAPDRARDPADTSGLRVSHGNGCRRRRVCREHRSGASRSSTGAPDGVHGRRVHARLTRRCGLDTSDPTWQVAARAGVGCAVGGDRLDGRPCVPARAEVVQPALYADEPDHRAGRERVVVLGMGRRNTTLGFPWSGGSHASWPVR